MSRHGFFDRRHLGATSALLALVLLASCGDGANDPVTGGTAVDGTTNGGLDGALGDGGADTKPGDTAADGQGEILSGDTQIDDTQDTGGATDLDGDADTGTDSDTATNTAPTVVISAPLDQAVVNLGEVVQLAATLGDAEDKELLLTVVSSALTQPLVDQPAPVGSYTLAADKLPAGKQTLTLTVKDSGGLTASASVVILVNSAPDAPVVGISPATPTTADELSADIVGESQDADRKPSELTYTYAWFKDGQPTSYTSKTLPAGTAKKGELWQVQVTAKDPYTAGKSGSAQVVIANAAPGLAELAVNPAAVDLASSATCTLAKAATDVDGDALTYNYAWQINGISLAGVASETVDVSLLTRADGSPLHAGDTLSCSAQAGDGSAQGPVALSAAVTLLAYDVCASAKNPCSAQASCSNTDTLTPTCSCNPGYSGDGKTCGDIDECADGSAACDPAATCSNSPGSFACACKAGYSGDGKSCSDVDECLVSNGGCDLAADCSNTVGSNTCACKPGYSGDGKSCVDVDECLSNNGGCDANATCSNTAGSNTCACKSGFAGDGKVCSDVNECLSGNGGCDLAADCSNTIGSNTCACKPGYSGDGKSCSDVDECASNFGGCSKDGICTNLPGSNSCACKDGFSGDGKTCTDIDECKTNNGGCGANATCSNSPGSSSCACNPGYSGDGKTCSDINECLTNNGGCSANATCSNTVGSNTCACKSGFTGDGKTCLDIDECNGLNIGVPKGLSGWVVLGSSPTVTWHEVGDALYYGDPIKKNFNTGTANNGSVTTSPLAVPANPAVVLAFDVTLAIESEASFDLFTISVAGTGAVLWSKPTGAAFKPNLQVEIPMAAYAGKEVQLVFAFDTKDSIANDTAGITLGKLAWRLDNCAATATCSNVPGSFQCACNSGYSGDGVTCSDIDECKTNNGGCGQPKAWTCVNNMGAAPTCIDIDECLTNNGGCNANATCGNTPGGNTCTCKAGYSGNGIACVDIDECKTNNGGCAVDGICTNLPGSSQCACKPGYSGDGKTCSDINECLSNNGGCSANATCTNTAGSNTCACKTGFTGDGKTCSDINECLTNNGGCAADATCTNTAGSNTCACKTGFSGDGKTCTDINECLTNNGGCSANATCTNTAGSNTCACKTGFSGDGKTCADVNECLAGAPSNPVDLQANLATWTVTASSATVKWQLINGALRYVNAATGNFNDGTTNSGTITSPELSISEAARFVEFAMIADTEGGTTYDLLTLTVIDGLDSFNVLGKSGVTVGTTPANYKLDLTAFLGKKVKLRYSFNTVDSVANDGTGITITKLALTGNRADCSANAACSNTAGSYTCGCNAGYTGDGKTCADVNECLTNNGGCSANANCTNTPGSSTCACKTGYIGDGKTCTAIAQSFGFVGKTETFTVPVGVTSVLIEAAGGGGGGGGNDCQAGGPGGAGGYVKATKALTVKAGDTLTIVVGGGGAAGASCAAGNGGGSGAYLGGANGGTAGQAGCSGGGGGGGGLSGVFIGSVSAANAVAVAAGGGGGGGAGCSIGGKAGSAGCNAAAQPFASATGGGNLTNTDGGGGGGGGSGYTSGAGGAGNASGYDTGGNGGGGGACYAQVALSATSSNSGGSAGAATANGGNGYVKLTLQ